MISHATFPPSSMRVPAVTPTSIRILNPAKHKRSDFSSLEDDPRPPTPWLSDRTPESSTQPSTSAVIFRAWSSSNIIFRRWVTGTPPVTHTYIQTISSEPEMNPHLPLGFPGRGFYVPGLSPN